jgi:hypothetical protein
MYRKQMYLNIPIHIFLTRSAGINKTFILKKHSRLNTIM